MKKLYLHKAVFIALFIALFFTVRLPFYSRPMYNEDGIFADLFVNQPPGPFYGQIARFNGKPVYTYLSHPGVLYETLRQPGRIATALLPLKTMNDEALTFTLRLLFSLVQLTFWLILIGCLCHYYKGAHFDPHLFWPLTALLALSATPLAIHNSIELQLDNTVGILMIGSIGWCLLVCSRQRLPQRAQLWLALLAAAWLGFGKNEWTYAFIASLGAGAAALWLDRRYTHYFDQRREFFQRLLLAFFLGSLVGNLASLVFDFKNYTGGVELLFGLSKSVNLAKTGEFHNWWVLTARRLPYIYTLVPLWGLLLLRLRNRITSGDFIALLALAYPAVMFSAYAMSYWNAEPRYFAPIFIIMMFAAAMVMAPTPGRKTRIMLAALSTLCLLHTGWYVYARLTAPPAAPILVAGRTVAETIAYSHKHGCVPILDIADCWNKPNVDYMATSIGYEDGKGHTRDAHKTMCDDVPGYYDLVKPPTETVKPR